MKRHINLTTIDKNDSFFEIDYGWTSSPFGPCLIYSYKNYIFGLAYGNKRTKAVIEVDMKSRWKHCTFIENSEKTKNLGREIFYKDGSLNLMASGTKFQTQVWHALLKISFGQTATYSEVSDSIGNSKSARAVANAIGRNPIAWLIPCHRVIRKSSGLGGYHWGLPLKKKMLSFERLSTTA